MPAGVPAGTVSVSLVPSVQLTSITTSPWLPAAGPATTLDTTSVAGAAVYVSRTSTTDSVFAAIVTVCGPGGDTTASTTPATAPDSVSTTVHCEPATIGATVCSLACRAIGITIVAVVPSVHDTARRTSPRKSAPGPSTSLRTRSDPVFATY